MPLNKDNLGIAIFCKQDGTINEILLDQINLPDYISPSQPFISLFDNDSINKAQLFFSTLKYQKSALDWELNINHDNKIKTLSFSGCLSDNELIIIAVTSKDYIDDFYEQLVKLNNKHIDLLKCIYHEKISTKSEQLQKEKLLYEELARVNNELVNTQRELAKKNIQLKVLNDEKNRFLGIASHDLMTPLSTINTYLEFLNEDDLTEDEKNRFLNIIGSSTNFMINLINNLLDISKIESGNFTLDLSETDIIKLLTNNIETNKLLANKKQIKINFIKENNIPIIKIDSFKIEQVLNNLISNAIKYSYPNTEIIVSVESTENNITISVKDQGQGIPESEFSKLFKPFQKTSVRTTANEKSTGLGLAIIKNIIDEHNGKIWLESKINEGTTFFIKLPLNR